MEGATTGEVAVASANLPERQREALTLRELQGLSYEEIATIMETSRDSVAKLIAHAWINLYDELRGTGLASVAPSPECERALSLIAAREDGELDAASPDPNWLERHLDDCDRCRRGVEEIREARTHFRTRGRNSAPSPHRRTTLAAGTAALLLFAGVAAAFVRDDPPAARIDRAPASAQGSDGAPRAGAQTAGPRKAKDGAAKGKTEARRRAAEATAAADLAAETAPAASTPPLPTATGGDLPSDPASRRDRPPDKTAIEATQRTSGSKPAPKPKPAPTSTTSPTVAPAPTSEAPPAEEQVDEPPRRREPPGKPADRPPR